MKPPSAIIGDGDSILLPSASERVEHEAEIGVVIGRRLHRVSESDAMAGVRGITCLNDVTARDLQKADDQWTRAKGFDTFCPVGPRVAAMAEFSDLDGIAVIGRVNGVERQRGRSGDMVFSIPMIVSYVSHVMTLNPNDLLATGTPAGVGPLRPGDVVEVEIPGVGVLRNTVSRA
jgi:2-keto-4-pentenoate hydratase/2-oxohepta-3-ene-1,7-dioic acid hydratase in catechol pathway